MRKTGEMPNGAPGGTAAAAFPAARAAACASRSVPRTMPQASRTVLQDGGMAVMADVLRREAARTFGCKGGGRGTMAILHVPPGRPLPFLEGGTGLPGGRAAACLLPVPARGRTRSGRPPCRKRCGRGPPVRRAADACRSARWSIGPKTVPWRGRSAVLAAALPESLLPPGRGRPCGQRSRSRPPACRTDGAASSRRFRCRAAPGAETSGRNPGRGAAIAMATGWRCGHRCSGLPPACAWSRDRRARGGDTASVPREGPGGRPGAAWAALQLRRPEEGRNDPGCCDVAAGFRRPRDCPGADAARLAATGASNRPGRSGNAGTAFGRTPGAGGRRDALRRPFHVPSGRAAAAAGRGRRRAKGVPCDDGNAVRRQSFGLCRLAAAGARVAVRCRTVSSVPSVR